MITLAIATQKGGSGKTTTAVNLAAALAARGERVLLIDLDGQASATAWLGASAAHGGTFDVLADEAELGAVLTSPLDNLDVCAADSRMFRLDRALGGEPGADAILRAALAAAALPHDWIICDCPPALGLATTMALVACKRALVPVEPSSLALPGITELDAAIKRVQRIEAGVHVGGVVVVRADGRSKITSEVTAQLRAHWGELVCSTQIREDVKLKQAPAVHLPAHLYAPDSRASADYAALAQELIRRWL